MATATATKTLGYYELLEGRHLDEDGKTHRKNAVVASEDNLEQKFGNNKFRRVTELEYQRYLKKAKRARKTNPETPVDVTHEFESASEMGFSVFRAGGVYFVSEADSPSEYLNKKGMSQDEVDAFIEEQA